MHLYPKDKLLNQWHICHSQHGWSAEGHWQTTADMPFGISYRPSRMTNLEAHTTTHGCCPKLLLSRWSTALMQLGSICA